MSSLNLLARDCPLSLSNCLEGWSSPASMSLPLHLTSCHLILPSFSCFQRAPRPPTRQIQGLRQPAVSRQRTHLSARCTGPLPGLGLPSARMLRSARPLSPPTPPPLPVTSSPCCQGQMKDVPSSLVGPLLSAFVLTPSWALPWKSSSIPIISAISCVQNTQKTHF